MYPFQRYQRYMCTLNVLYWIHSCDSVCFDLVDLNMVERACLCKILCCVRRRNGKLRKMARENVASPCCFIIVITIRYSDILNILKFHCSYPFILIYL